VRLRTRKFSAVVQYNTANHISESERRLPTTKTSLEDCLRLSRIRISTVDVPNDSTRRNRIIAAISSTNCIHFGRLCSGRQQHLPQSQRSTRYTACSGIHVLVTSQFWRTGKQTDRDLRNKSSQEQRRACSQRRSPSPGPSAHSSFPAFPSNRDGDRQERRSTTPRDSSWLAVAASWTVPHRAKPVGCCRSTHSPLQGLSLGHCSICYPRSVLVFIADKDYMYGPCSIIASRMTTSDMLIQMVLPLEHLLLSISPAIKA
jgi:hypothetical protein